MPYKNMADQVAANRRYRERQKQKAAKKDELTVAYENVVKAYRDAVKKNEKPKDIKEQ